MSVFQPDLVDADAVDAYLLDHLTDPITDQAVAAARTLAEDALSRPEPPVGAHVVLARLAELAGDSMGFADHTRRALAIDPTFGPALEDHDYLAFLQQGAGRRAGPARRAELLWAKADRWTGRVPQLGDQFALAEQVLGVDDVRASRAAVELASLWQFLGVLLFERGLVSRFAADCAPFLSAVERAMLASWQVVRHRFVRLEHQQGRLGRFTDRCTGEDVEAAILHDDGLWPPGRSGMALLVPTGDRLALVGEPVLLDDDMAALLQDAGDGVDPMVLVRTCLQLCLLARIEEVLAARAERIGFVLPGLEVDGLDVSEEGVLEHVRDRAPSLAARADHGDVDAEARLLLDAIVAHRVITLRVPQTWELAVALLAEGHDRTFVLERLRAVTFAELAGVG